ncbi:hypothetical protein V6N13_087901 [Hibiscus sabdariffa]
MEVDESGMEGLSLGAAKLAALNEGSKEGTTAMYAAMEDCSRGGEDSREACVNKDGVGPRVAADGSLTERYGPWMAATNHRLHFTPPSSVVKVSADATGLGSGSRFAILNMEDNEVDAGHTMEARRGARGMKELVDTIVEVGAVSRGKKVVQDDGMRFNKAYMAYNPKRQSKVRKGAPSGSKKVEVVSLVEGVVAEGMSRDAAFGVRSSGRVPVTGWMSGVSDMIDDEARRMQHGLDRDYEVMDDDASGGGNSAVEMTDQSMCFSDEVAEVGDDEVVP